MILHLVPKQEGKENTLKTSGTEHLEKQGLQRLDPPPKKRDKFNAFMYV